MFLRLRNPGLDFRQLGGCKRRFLAQARPGCDFGQSICQLVDRYRQITSKSGAGRRANEKPKGPCAAYFLGPRLAGVPAEGLPLPEAPLFPPGLDGVATDEPPVV